MTKKQEFFLEKLFFLHFLWTFDSYRTFEPLKILKINFSRMKFKLNIDKLL